MSREDLGVSIQLPAGFEVGAFATRGEDGGDESPFATALVLVEPDQLRDAPVEAIPVGVIPVVYLDRTTNGVLRQLTREEFAREIGGRTVYWLPGYPGPYGDQAFYVLVPTSDESLIEIVGHRFLFRDPDLPSGEAPPSGYDTVMREILDTLEVL